MLPFVKGKDTTGKEAGTLKRLLALMMVVAVTAALLACTKGGRDNEDGNDTPDPEPQYVGAVQEFTDPKTQQEYLYFPIRAL